MLKIQSRDKTRFRTFSLLIALWLAAAIPFAAPAQMVPSNAAEASAVEIPEDLTREQVRDLIARMSDDQVRELIISRLDKLAQQQEQAAESTAYVGQLREGVRAGQAAIARIFTSDNKISALPAKIWRQITDNGKVSGAYLLFQLIGLLVVGLIAERLAKRLLQKTTSKPAAELSLDKRFNLACYSMVMGTLGLGAFGVGALLFVEITSQQSPSAQLLWHQVIWCLVLIKLVLMAVRQVVSPDSPDSRLVSVTDVTVKQILAWTVIISSSLVLPLPMIKVLINFGVDAETILLLRFIFGAIFIALLIVLVVRLRDYGTKLIIGVDASSESIRHGIARIWWMLAIVYILLIYFMSIGKRAATGESSLALGLGSLLLFISIPYLDIALRWLITRIFEAKEDEAPPEEGPAAEESIEANSAAAALVEPDAATVIEVGAEDIEAGTENIDPSGRILEPGYIATALRYARVLMVLALITIFVRMWHIDLEAISAALIGDRFANALFGIGITILLTWSLWGVIRISIERKLDDGKGPAEEGETESDPGGLGGTRVETILPLIRVCIKITLITMAVLISLSSLGVNIGPLIAGAGVVGIAIGFGAQTLVRDIVSGFFYLIDDAFRVGEYVVIDQIKGTVEKISIRSFQLRHHNGPVHTIPYGEIRSLTNWSRDWAIMKFELRIAFETDIDQVRKIIKQIGTDMMADPVFGAGMLMPVKSQGVNRMDDSALIIRCKFTAIPGQQFLIRREAFTRIQKAFEENGIKFAPRRVVVESTSSDSAAAGAAAAMDQELEGKPAAKDN